MDKQTKIAILGLGVEGKAMLEYLVRHNFLNITVCDQDIDVANALPKGVSSQLGKDVYLNDLDKFEVIFRTPGVKFLTPQIQLALIKGVKVTSCIKYFLENCPCPVVGISGTKGKGTTATLIHEILQEGGYTSYLGGNIGKPPVTFLDDVKPNDVVVLELSSFQLQDLDVSPRYAVLLNTTNDHLDYHIDRDEYMRAKEGLIANQPSDGVVVMNKDYEYVDYYKSIVKGKTLWISRKEKVENGAYEKDGTIFYCQNGACSEIIKTSEIGLIGSHNLENAMPAISIAKEFMVKDSVVAKILKEFKGLPNRLEFVREVSGVKYYNDSFSTNAETSMAAIDSFDQPTVLIAGGSDKNLSYAKWAEKILTKESLRTVILIGATADIMENALMAAEGNIGHVTPTKILRKGDLAEATLEACMEAEEGWVVVMSPAAASFDMFKNYKERGEKFKEIVKILL
ncbi:MAG: UDP-N-acetylmuramoyl-L-alanine--D-glutamate ligase [Candidatus Gracilibacteria bacterium]